MYYLYIDESGDFNEYLDDTSQIINGRSKFFTLGGIIVDDDGKYYLEYYFKYILQKYFNGIKLPENFKLHYNALRQREYPFDQLEDKDRFELTNEVFNQIINTECCYLLSVTIDKEKHCKNYNRPANVLGYALLLILERFQYFLNEYGDSGKAIYERYNSKMSKIVDRTHRWLRSLSRFPNANLEKIQSKIVNGNPKDHTILQYSDFFAYAPWIRSQTCYRLSEKYDRLKHKYYNLDYPLSFKRGNYEI